MKLPVIHKTAWIHPKNRPEKLTARPTSLKRSSTGSIGGRGVHMVAEGIGAVLKAPRLYADAPIAPMRQEKKPVPSLPKPCHCSHCGGRFPSRNARERHQRKDLCDGRIRVAYAGGDPS